MQPKSPDIPLHDIKPLVEVPDTSLYLFMGVVAAVLLIAGVLLYALWRYLRRDRVSNLRKQAFEALEAVDFSDPKHAAYAITEHGRFFAEDSPRHGEVFDNLTTRLEAYKYKKEVAPIDSETEGYYRNYLEMIDA